MTPSPRFDPDSLSPDALALLARRLRCAAPSATVAADPAPARPPLSAAARDALLDLLADAARLRRMEGDDPEEAAGMLCHARPFLSPAGELAALADLALALAATMAEEDPALAEAFIALAAPCAAAARAAPPSAR